MRFKRWLRGHPLIAVLLALGAIFLNWLPQWAASVWSLFSSQPLFEYLSQHHLLPRVTFSSLWITTPLSLGILLAILLSLRKKETIHEAEKPSLNPRLEIACDPNVDGCIKVAMWRIDSQTLPVRFLRLAVKADGAESVKNCTGFLTLIQKDGDKKWSGENANLTFAPGEDPDALAKTVYRFPSFLDVLIVTSGNDIFPGTKGRVWPYVPALHHIFADVGEYMLTVIITGDGVAIRTAMLKFNWTRNWQTSWLSLISSD